MLQILCILVYKKSEYIQFAMPKKKKTQPENCNCSQGHEMKPGGGGVGQGMKVSFGHVVSFQVRSLTLYYMLFHLYEKYFEILFIKGSD